MIELDVPQLTSNGIQFSSWCFQYTYSLQSSSTHSLISSSLDAPTLESFIRNSSYIQIEAADITLQGLTEWVVRNGQYNNYNDSLCISGNSNLKRIVIGDGCFKCVRLFELDGLNELESVVIGEWSFKISDKERTDGECRIVNCPKLKSIQIGNGSFIDYRSFELNNLPSLESIDIGDKCFGYALSFSLIGLID